MNNRAKLEWLQPEIENLSKELKTEVMAAQQLYGWNSITAMSYFRTNVRDRHSIIFIMKIVLVYTKEKKIKS